MVSCRRVKPKPAPDRGRGRPEGETVLPKCIAPMGLLVVLSAVLPGCPEAIKAPPAPIQTGHLTLGFPGPYAENRFYANIDDTFNVTVFYPVADAPIQNAPVIVFNVGWNAIRNTYESYCIQLAQWGYVCVVRYYPSLGMLGIGNDLFDAHVAHCLRTIDWVAEQNADPASPIFGMADPANVGLVGHSLGGSVALVAAPQHPNVRTVVSLDALWDHEDASRTFNFAAFSGPILYLAASESSLCSQAPNATQDLWAMTQRPKQRVTILGADHMDFMEDNPAAVDSTDAGNTFCATGYLEASEVRATAHRYLIPWLNYHLRGQLDFADWFAGDQALEDVRNGLTALDIVF